MACVILLHLLLLLLLSDDWSCTGVLALLYCLPQHLGLDHVRLEQQSHPVSVVVHGEVGQPGASVGVHHHLVPLHTVHDNGLPRHAVLVVVLVVLVEDGGDLLAVLPDGEQGLLVVVGGNVELEEIDASNRAGEDPGVNIQTFSFGYIGTHYSTIQ